MKRVCLILCLTLGLLAPASGQNRRRTWEAKPEPSPVMLPPGMTLPGMNLPVQQYLPVDLRTLLEPSGLWPLFFEAQGQLPDGTFFPLPWLLDGQQRPRLDISSKPALGQPVENYTFMMVNGVPCRFPTAALPIKIYTPFAYYRPVAQQAMDLWNRVGEGLPQSRPFFVQVTTPEEAQLTVDWLGTGLPEKAAGITHFRMSNKEVLIRGVSLREVAKQQPGEVAETLAHELGHALGLDHSDDPKDLMYRSQNFLFTKPTSKVSTRDSWMMGWLYSQQNIVPIHPVGAAPTPSL